VPHAAFAATCTLVLASLVAGVCPALALQTLRLTAPVGQVQQDEFSLLVSDAGDLDGDGRFDFVVGSPGNSAAGQSAGRAYVFLGGAGLDSIPDVILTGQAAFDNFGRAAAGAGDVNGDGFGDLIVGARNNDTIRRDAGRAYLFFGGAPMNAVADVFFNGIGESDQFGNSVDGAGDFNGDGYADVIVGANRQDYGLPTLFDDRGRAYVYYGGPSPDGVVDWFASGQAPGDQFATTVAGAGDVNGDGYDDVIVGAIKNDAGGGDAGRAYVYFGGAVPDTVPDLVLTGDSPADEFGTSVDGGGDWNGDGYADLLVGATFDDAGGADAGRCYLFLGGPGADATPDRMMTGVAAGDQFGRWARFAGDVDGDGFGDVIAGAIYHDQLGADRGAAYLFLGGPGADGLSDQVFDGEAAGDELGCAVSGAGDVDGDGRTEVLIGAHYNATAGYQAGRAYLYRVLPAGVSVPALPTWAALVLSLALLAAGVGTLRRVLARGQQGVPTRG
jgi:hypothetical protein